LPVENAFTVQTTAGTPTVTVTGGPDLLRPGDYVWSDAFPFGSVVLDATGTVGAQTVTLTQYHMNYNATLNASVTHTSGAPGHMWIVPAAVKMFVATVLRNNYLATFGFGLEMECSYWSATVHAGCNASLSEGNTFVFDIVGRVVMGDNAGASTSIANIYSYNSFADIVEGGAVGSTYFSENANSQEASTALYSIVGECVNSNSSSFFGGYAPTNGGYCLNGQFGAPTTGGTVMFIAGQVGQPYGTPTLYNGGFHNHWYFSGDDTAATELCMNMPGAPLSWSRDGQHCGGPETWQLGWDTRGFWGLSYFSAAGGAPMRLTEGSSYTGYTIGNAAFVAFPQGLLLSSTQMGSVPGPERLVDMGNAVPTETSHKQGDIHFLTGAQPGYYAGMVNTADGANFKPFGAVMLDPPTGVTGGCGATLGHVAHGGEAFTVNTGTGACTSQIRLAWNPPYGASGWACNANDLSDGPAARTVMLGPVYYAYTDFIHYSIGATPAAVNFAPSSEIVITCSWL
jgi:hypothetical protein